MIEFAAFWIADYEDVIGIDQVTKCFGECRREYALLDLAQCADERVAVLAAYFAVFVAVPIVETWFFHGITSRLVVLM